MEQYHYKLQKYRTKASRFTCPSCGKPHCFTRYICVETGRYVHESCGRCDHEASCGYNYTPSQFYRDNPWENRGTESSVRTHVRYTAPPPPPPPIYIDRQLPVQRLSTSSAFYQWLSSVVGDSPAQAAMNRYYIGATYPGKFRSPAVIFWQIDKNFNVHDGKMMWYKANGHREQYMTWVSSRLKASGIYPDQDTVKCLFGEHLLASCSDSSVICIVESEKSAIVCSCLFPRQLWLASCGCGGLNASKLRPLYGHRVLVFPDSGEADRWEEILKGTGITYAMLSIDNYPRNTDLVDIIVDHVQPTNGTAADIAAFLNNNI